SALPLLTPAERQQIAAWSAEGQIFLLDQHHQPVPIGVPGDVYIGDTGLAGEERAEAAPHPFDTTPGARVFRTGQRARFRADGTTDISHDAGAEATRAPEARAFVAPRTPVEEALAGIWMGILGQGRIGVHDDFFALGGHSLSAARLLTRVRETF